jgi:hypothetical protein
MSVDYTKYLDQHLKNVYKGYVWILDNLPEILDDEDSEVMTKETYEWQIRYSHDYSKFREEEYNAYDKYFYGGNKTEEVKKNFNMAWLHHIHNNPHHWQYWILINDNPGEGMVILDMPYNYIIEMICDWWSFSWAKGDLYEIFKWYDERKAYMKLSDKTRKTVEDILAKLKVKLDEGKEIDDD